MRFIITTVFVLAIIWVAAYFVLRPRPGNAQGRSADAETAKATMELRDRLLSGAASDFGIDPDQRVWGVLMEIGTPDGSATLVALGDGSASLYLSTGGGVIGGAAHVAVRKAARDLLRSAETHLDRMSPRSSFPLPEAGRVTFYVLERGRVVGAEVGEEELGRGTHPLSLLFFGGHDVISKLREAERPFR